MAISGSLASIAQLDMQYILKGLAAHASTQPGAVVCRTAAPATSTDECRELYAGVNKLLNCGGMGNCGTCGVDVLRGSEFLSERTDPEARKLSAGKLKESWRLSCQCVVDGPDGAELEVALRPKK